MFVFDSVWNTEIDLNGWALNYLNSALKKRKARDFRYIGALSSSVIIVCKTDCITENRRSETSCGSLFHSSLFYIVRYTDGVVQARAMQLEKGKR
jgi:hypothetical protein